MLIRHGITTAYFKISCIFPVLKELLITVDIKGLEKKPDY